jgi:Cutinase
MAVQRIFVGALAFGSLVSAMPRPRYYSYAEQMQLANATRAMDIEALAIWECLGQSCLAADASGSSGKDPKVWPEGGGMADKQCIAKYNPAMANMLKAANGPKQSTGISSSLLGGINSIWRPLTQMTGSTEKGKFTGTCAPNILIFAKGTFEPGAYGMLVGPSFTSGLPAGWTTYPVSYDPDVPGDYCLGLPGGMVAKDIINQAVEKCPDSNLYLSGYSQGAMVARNGIAYANPEAKSHIKVRIPT